MFLAFIYKKKKERQRHINVFITFILIYSFRLCAIFLRCKPTDMISFLKNATGVFSTAKASHPTFKYIPMLHFVLSFEFCALFFLQEQENLRLLFSLLLLYFAVVGGGGD